MCLLLPLLLALLSLLLPSRLLLRSSRRRRRRIDGSAAELSQERQLDVYARASGSGLRVGKRLSCGQSCTPETPSTPSACCDEARRDEAMRLRVEAARRPTTAE